MIFWGRFSEVKNLFRPFHKKWIVYENDEIFKNFMIFDMSKHQVFPRKYLTFLRVTTTFWEWPALFRPKSWNSAHFGVLEPQSALLGPKWDLGAPGAKLVINVRFWELFWRPRGGKADFGGRKQKKCNFPWNPAEYRFLEQKVRKSQNGRKPPNALPILL